MARPKSVKALEERFWAKVERADGCWLWRGARWADTGYGQIRSGHRKMQAHRVSYEIANGPIPPGMSICHRCDVRLCVRPDHLFAGTPADNVADAVAKGRQSAARGNAQPLAKLTPSLVLAIRYLRSGGLSMKRVARLFGISIRAVGKIDRRELWAHVA
jgi:hypothetical protein